MRKTLTAKDGFVYTNGEVHAKIIDLADGIDSGDFYEITEEEYQEILKEQEENYEH